jgi:hypothetical protein
MKQTSRLLEEVAHKVAQCLEEFEFEPELRPGEGELLIAAKRCVDGKTVRAVFHIADRKAKPFAAAAATDERLAYRAKSVIRPTLSAQSASRCDDRDDCEDDIE